MTIKEYLKEELEEIKEMLKYEDLAKDFINETAENLKDDLNHYFSDLVSEFADLQIDIYYNDLLDWAKDNIYWCDEALGEFGETKDFIKIIQEAQFLKYNDVLYKNAEMIKKALFLIILYDKLEQMDKLEKTLKRTIEIIKVKVEEVEDFDDFEELIEEAIDILIN